MTHISQLMASEAIECLSAFLNDLCHDESEHGLVRKIAQTPSRWCSVQDFLTPPERTAFEQIAFKSATGGFSPGNLKAHYVLDEDFINDGSAFVLFSLVASGWSQVVAVGNQNRFTSASEWLAGIRA